MAAVLQPLKLVEAHVAGRLYHDAWRRWHGDLGWDTAASWAIVEEGRRHGHVHGAVLRGAAGDVLGWTFYILNARELQIGGLVADDEPAVRRLLDYVLESRECRLARSVSCHLFPSDAILREVLEARGFQVRRLPYLTRLMTAPVPPADRVDPDVRPRPMAVIDLVGAVPLFTLAYQGVPHARCFAPHGRPDEWRHYLAQLAGTPACGRFLPDMSAALEDCADGALLGVAIATELGARTLHLAQIAILPARRGHRLADQLLQQVHHQAAAAGFERLTLLVDEDNRSARRLYDRWGFRETAQFVFGVRAA